MKIVFEPEKWREIIKRPDWYMELARSEEEVRANRSLMSDEEFGKLRGQVFNFFQENYLAGNLNLAQSGPDWDSEREEIDTIVTHHTAGEPGMTWQTISAIHLLNVYAAFYANPYSDEEGVKGKAIYSGHFRDSFPVFYGYHFIVRNDGKYERLLSDEEIGWHAGNWDINKRSIAIVFDGNLENEAPPQAALQTAAEIIREMYPQIPKERVFGHKEVKKRGATTCPGGFFLPSEGHPGWKNTLLEMI